MSQTPGTSDPIDNDTDLIRAMAARMLGVVVGEDRLTPIAAAVGRLVAVVAQEAKHLEIDSDPNEYYITLHRIAAERRRRRRAS